MASAPLPSDSPDGDPAFAGLHTARTVARGISRLFARNDIWCLPEMPLRSGRRADLMGIDAKGQVIIVEIKVSRADLMGDAKWQDYLDHCDRFFWGLAPHLDRACMESEAFHPDKCGLIVADGYDAEILRPAPLIPLAAARRKAEVERLARASLRRQVVGPASTARSARCSGWLMVAQPAISARVRLQPAHRPLAGSIRQVPSQGETGGFMALLSTEPGRAQDPLA